jgi:hypothetical protein
MSWMTCGDSVTERVWNDHLLDGQKSQNCPLNIPACSWHWVWACKPHMYCYTDSDQSVIEEWDPTILLETPYNIIMIL